MLNMSRASENGFGFLAAIQAMNSVTDSARDPATRTTETADTDTLAPPLLFNDVYFGRRESQEAPGPSSTWAPFPRLPTELRMHIWRLHLTRAHRMMEFSLMPVAIADDDNDGGGNASSSQPYTNRNHLGRIVSGRSYTFCIQGRGLSDSASPTSLLGVNREAREAARSFYSIHLPLGTGPVLYLSSEYDLVHVEPRRAPEYDWVPPADPNPKRYPGWASILVDFLHDARAYDYKDQGYVPCFFSSLRCRPWCDFQPFNRVANLYRIAL